MNDYNLIIVICLVGMTLAVFNSVLLLLTFKELKQCRDEMMLYRLIAKTHFLHSGLGETDDKDV